VLDWSQIWRDQSIRRIALRGVARRCAILSWELKRLQPLWSDGVGRHPSHTDERSRRWAVSYVGCGNTSGVWARSGCCELRSAPPRTTDSPPQSQRHFQSASPLESLPWRETTIRRSYRFPISPLTSVFPPLAELLAPQAAAGARCTRQERVCANRLPTATFAEAKPTPPWLPIQHGQPPESLTC
jgi:hypothetical protein